MTAPCIDMAPYSPMPGTLAMLDSFLEQDNRRELARLVIKEEERFVDAQYDQYLFSVWGDRQKESSLRRKKIHTRFVRMQERRYINASGGYVEKTIPPRRWNRVQADLLADFHDVGRPPEVLVHETLNGGKTGFSHADVGADWIIAAFSTGGSLYYLLPALEVLDCDIAVIAESVLHHSRKKINILHPNEYHMGIRYWDKHAILGDIEGYVFPSMINDAHLHYGPVSPHVIEEFFYDPDHMVSNGNIQTYADDFVAMGGWLFDLDDNHLVRRMFIHDGLPGTFLQYLSAFQNAGKIIQEFPNLLAKDWSQKTGREYSPEQMFFSKPVPNRTVRAF